MLSGTFGEDSIEMMDTKLAIWSSMLPASKKDPLRKDGTVDEVMFLAQYVNLPASRTLRQC